jgi:thioredoxin 1
MASNLEQFQATIRKTDKPVFVEWGASWCSPCRVFGPTFEALGKQLVAQATFIKVDVDAGPDITAAYGVSTIPIIKVFLKGEPVDELNGPKEATFKKLLAKHGVTLA